MSAEADRFDSVGIFDQLVSEEGVPRSSFKGERGGWEGDVQAIEMNATLTFDDRLRDPGNIHALIQFKMSLLIGS